jgi:hypothetical protein
LPQADQNTALHCLVTSHKAAAGLADGWILPTDGTDGQILSMERRAGGLTEERTDAYLCQVVKTFLERGADVMLQNCLMVCIKQKRKCFHWYCEYNNNDNNDNNKHAYSGQIE